MHSDFVYLASASPRRADLLSQIGVPFERRPAHVDESPRPGESPRELVCRLAQAKAEAVWQRLRPGEERPVVAADTVVVLDGEMLGKPTGREDALRMLAALSGRGHDVLTAVTVRFGDDVETLLSSSAVRFRAISQDERMAYCATGEPFDKAGAYGVQGFGAAFVEYLSGSHSGVMGLPLVETVRLLKRFGLPAWLGGGEMRS